MINNLLKILFELKSMQSDISTWEDNFVASNPPRKIRLDRIKSILKSLEITSIESFFNFDFIVKDNYDKDRLIQIINEEREIVSGSEIDDYIKMLDHPISENRKGRLKIKAHPGGEGLSKFLQKLGKDCLRLEEVNYQYKNIYSNYLTVDIPSYITISIHKENLESFGNDSKSMKILEYLINPKSIQYSIKELEERFNYPKEDLDEIDLDWF